MDKDTKIKILICIRNNPVLSVLLYLFSMFLPAFFMTNGFGNILFLWWALVVCLTCTLVLVCTSAYLLRSLVDKLLKSIGGKQ